MKKFLRANSFFLGCFLLFVILGGGLLFQIEKPEAILFFSERRTPFFDVFFSFATKMGEELTYLTFIVIFLFIKIRHSLLIPLVGFLVAGISIVTKNFFAHDRPLVFLEKMGIDHQVNYVDGIELYTGPTSFPSGHTMSAFALYGLVAFLIAEKKISGVFLFVIALL
ncbi:MAG TPA: phosphatase PAP2 family protein, partial [Phaeodactylibacter sp.]|nr:phosphatase PAP2 family protein [Phaeodactylibacter sp.]